MREGGRERGREEDARTHARTHARTTHARTHKTKQRWEGCSQQGSTEAGCGGSVGEHFVRSAKQNRLIFARERIGPAFTGTIKTGLRACKDRLKGFITVPTLAPSLGRTETNGLGLRLRLGLRLGLGRRLGLGLRLGLGRRLDCADSDSDSDSDPDPDLDSRRHRISPPPHTRTRRLVPRRTEKDPTHAAFHSLT